MQLQRILAYAKHLIELCTTSGDITIDATIGNGHDTLFLSQLVGEQGKVFGFDIQEQAIQNTKKLLEEHHQHNVTLFLKGHEYVKECIPITYHHNISSAIFNLGYLPNGDESITTHANTTISAINQLLELIKVGGIIVLVIYSGHKEGKEEMNELIRYLSLLNLKYVQVLQYRFLNQKNDAPFVCAIEKIK